MDILDQLIAAGDIRLHIENNNIQGIQIYILQFKPEIDWYWLNICAQETGMDLDAENHGLILFTLSFSPSVVGGEGHARQ